MPAQKVTREEMLHRCWEEIHRNGYYGTTVSQLARAAGLGKAGLLHHFNSKEELMRAVVDYAVDRFRDYVLEVASEDLPWEQRIEKMLRRHKNLVRIDRRGCFFANTILETGRDELFNRAIHAALQEWHLTLSGLLTERMPAHLARQQAYQIQVSFEGAVVFYKLTGDDIHLESMVERTLNDLQKLSV